MRWWGKAIRFCILVTVVGCQNDDVSHISPPIEGNDNQLKIQYIELEVPSGVLLVDSIQTTYSSAFQSGKRLMVGRYSDDKFGVVSAQAYMQFGPHDNIIKIADNAKLVSGLLVLSFDYYHYGTKGLSTNSFIVHELTEEIMSDQPYVFNSSVQFNTAPVGEASYGVSAESFDDKLKRIYLADNTMTRDEVDSLTISLNQTFISKLFEAARAQGEDYTDIDKFKTAFPGLMIRSGAVDSKIVGFNMDNSAETLSRSKIVLQYDEPDPTTGEDVRKTLVYSLYRVNNSVLRGFTQILVDRSETPLGNLKDLYTEFEPLKVRYYQSGNPIVPSVDFTRLLEFIDTIPNIVLNSVELSIDLEEDANQLPPPTALQLRLLNNKNEFISASEDFSEENIDFYPELMSSDERDWLILRSPRATQSELHLVYDEDDHRYYGDFTVFFQAMWNTRSNELKRPRRFGIVAKTPWIDFSVNRFWFKSENIKLKMFYTTP